MGIVPERTVSADGSTGSQGGHGAGSGTLGRLLMTALGEGNAWLREESNGRGADDDTRRRCRPLASRIVAQVSGSSSLS